ncbi:MAG: hypothetical protein IKT31_00805 [Firmicutes bacterium]|nr:hypothetical protein [Bacillota bacterium]
MFDINKRMPACAAVLIIYGVMYVLSGTLLAGITNFAFVLATTILLCVTTSIMIVLIENCIAGIISAVGYPFAVLFGSIFGTVNEAEGTYNGWNKCLYMFFAIAAAAVLFFRLKKVQKTEAEKAKLKTRL